MAEAFVKAHPEIFGDEEEEEDSDQETFHDAHPLPQTEPQGDEFSDVKKTSGASITPGSISQHIRENGLKPDEEEKDENKKEAEKEETEEELSKRERKEREDALTQEEREALKEESQVLKKEGNEFYLSGSHEEAIEKYSQALEVCPLEFKDDHAVLLSNRAAAHIKLNKLDSALDDCSSSITLKPDYVKALARRGQVFEDTNKPHEAMRDFEEVLKFDKGHKEANIAIRRLPEKIRIRDEEIKQEMFGNLKKLGNMVLNPFGMSTENFQFVQDPNTGGYSVNFKNS